MENNKYAAVSNEELIQNEKKAKALTIIFAVTLVCLFVTIILLTLKKGFSALIATPIALLPLLFVSLSRWKELKKEMKARNIG